MGEEPSCGGVISVVDESSTDLYLPPSGGSRVVVGCWAQCAIERMRVASVEVGHQPIVSGWAGAESPGPHWVFAVRAAPTWELKAFHQIS